VDRAGSASGRAIRAARLGRLRNVGLWATHSAEASRGPPGPLWSDR
jgi:hypothetical protein